MGRGGAAIGGEAGALVAFRGYGYNSRVSKRLALFPRPVSMHLSEIQTEVDRYIGQFKEGYFPPLVNLARLTEEVGELARELNHRHGPKRKKADEPNGDLGLELADILFVVVVLANQHSIDLEESLERTLTKYRIRDADRWERRD